MSQSDDTFDTPPRRGWGVLLPLILFFAIAGLFLYALETSDGVRKLPSALIGKQVPAFALDVIPDLKNDEGQITPTFTNADLSKGKISIVNVWASWCVSCRYEHPVLTKMAERTNAQFYGLNYKDTASAARQFLKRFGNPYIAAGMDQKGRVGIDWGVYGVPETFVIDGTGKIIYKYPGPVTMEIIESKIVPAIEKARKAKVGS